MANNTMTKLQTVTVGSGGVASVTFSAIPQNYTDLVLKVSARGDSSTNGFGYVQFNGSSSNFQRIHLDNNGGTPASYSASDNLSFSTTLSTNTANTFNSFDVYIPNYTSSNYKSFSVDCVVENNASTTNILDILGANLWSNTSAITSVSFNSAPGNFVQYSIFTLYGVYSGSSTPSTPTIASATDLGGGTAQIAISSPAAIPYTVTSSPSGITATGMSPINISGLSPQTSYTFTAQAVAPFGVSAASSASSSVSMYNGMTALATVTLGSPTGSIYFTSIPQNYNHLQVRIFGKNTGTSGSFDFSWMIFNSDSGANYAYHRIYGDGSSAQSSAGSNSSAIYYGEYPTTTGYSNIFGAGIIDILDYSNTSKNKTIRNLFGHDENGSGRVGMYSGFWNSTAAITAIQFNGNSYNFQTGSTFVLYGVK